MLFTADRDIMFHKVNVKTFLNIYKRGTNMLQKVRY